MSSSLLLPAPPEAPPAPAQQAVSLAPFWARALAALVDALAMFGLQVQAYALGVLLGRNSDDLRLAIQLAGLLLVVGVAVAQLVRQGRSGSTWGKQLVGLQVRDLTSGQLIGPTRSLLRALAHVLDTVTVVGYLLPLVQRHRQTLADSVTGTVVVRSGRTPRPQRRKGRTVFGLIAALQVLTLMSAAGNVDLLRADPAVAAAELEDEPPDQATDAAPPGRAVTAATSAPGAPTTPARRAAPAPRRPLAAGDLEGRIMPATSDYTQVPDSEFDLGTIDAVAASKLGGASASEAEAALAVFKLLGYKDGLGHGYGGDSALYTVLVYRFADAEGAKTLVDAARPDTPGAFTSKTVPAALTFTEPVADGIHTQIGLFADRSYVYELNVFTRQPDEGHVLFDQLLKRQRAHVQTT